MRNKLNFVLLPGLDGTGSLFKNFTSCGDFEYEVTAYPERLASLSDYSEYVSKKIVRDTILIAESFSGPVAASLQNKKIRGICFAATFLKPPRPYLLQLARLLPATLFNTTPPDFFLERYMSTNPEITAALKETLKSVSPAVIKKRLNLLAELKVPREILQVPVLYLQAEEDNLVNAASAGDFQIYENLTVKKIKGSHLILQENPQDCLNEIDEWIKRKLLPG